jgi:glyoxylase-like metal-dependent hydrolase (beta-lactamase superfamily II)
MRLPLAPLLLAAVVPWIPPVAAQGIDYAKIEILTEKLAPNLYILSGSGGADPAHEDAAGGRIGILTGSDGVFMVDSQYAQLTDKVLAAIRKISSEPIRFLVNTHVHPDHTAGNASFVKMGALLFAREELREELDRPPANPAQTAARDPARLPVVTYGLGDPVKLRIDGEIVDLIPVRAAHTGGDTVIRFENADVIMIGDFYRNYGYPFIDVNNGGTLKGALEALDQTMKLAGPTTRLVPGHGTIIHQADIVPYRDMILDIQTKVQRLISQGKSEQEVLAAKLTAPYDAKVPGGQGAAGGGTSADRFIRMVYSQLKSAQ